MKDCEKKDIYGDILQKAEANKIPLWAHIDLSYQCNLSCIHCYCQGLSPEFSGGRRELETEEWKDLLDQLAEAGSLYLTISGGEILIHPDFFVIARHAKKRHFCLTFLTNGTLIDEKIAQKIKDLSPRMVALSLYGATAETHDMITGSKGSFDLTINTIRLLKRHGLRVEVRSIIMENNCSQADAIEALSRSLGADDYDFNVEISRKNDGSIESQKCQMKEDSIRSFMIERLKRLPEDKTSEHSEKPLERQLCATGATGCYISPYGEVYPCILLLISMGNIREKKFKDIWYTRSHLREELDGLKKYGDLPLCKACEYVGSCRLCMGLAFLETGDMKKCYNTLKLLSRTEYEVVSQNRGGSNGKESV